MHIRLFLTYRSKSPRSEEKTFIIEKHKRVGDKHHVTVIIFSMLQREWFRGLPKPQNWGKRPTLLQLSKVSTPKFTNINQNGRNLNKIIFND